MHGEANETSPMKSEKNRTEIVNPWEVSTNAVSSLHKQYIIPKLTK
jgi:hypothetical protein